MHSFTLYLLESEHNVIKNLQDMPIRHELQKSIRLLFDTLLLRVLVSEGAGIAAQEAHVRSGLAVPLGPQLNRLVSTVEE